MTIERLQFIRRTVFFLIGICCVFYGVVYLLVGFPNTLYPFLPGFVGVAGALTIFAASFLGGQGVHRAVFDELSRMEWGKAIKFGYWFAIAMYPVFGLLLWQGQLDYQQVFAVMGTLTGGVPLLYYCWLDVRG